MALRTLGAFNYETIEGWASKYNLLATDVGDFAALTFSAGDVVAALNVNDSRIDELNTRVGPASTMNGTTQVDFSGNNLYQTTRAFWDDYHSFTGRQHTLTTAASNLLLAINELDAELGVKTSINDQIEGATHVATFNNVNTKINTDIANLNTLDTRVGPQSNITILTTDGLNSSNITLGISSFWTDYKNLTGRGTNLTTASNTLAGGINELDAELGVKTSLHNDIEAATIVGTINALNTKANTTQTDLDTLEGYVGVPTTLDGTTQVDFSGNTAFESIREFWDDYHSTVGRNVTNATGYSNIMSTLNFFNTTIGSKSSISDEIEGLNLVATFNNVNAKINTDIANLNILDTRVGPASVMDGTTQVDFSGNSLYQTTRAFWDDYHTFVGRGTTLTTASSNLVGAINELDAELGVKTSIVNEIEGATFAATFNNVNTKINTLDTSLQNQITSNDSDIASINSQIGVKTSINDQIEGATHVATFNNVNTKINTLDTSLTGLTTGLRTDLGNLSSLNSGFVGANNDSVVNALNFVYSLQTGETQQFTNAVISGTLDIGGITTIDGATTVDDSLTVTGAFTSRGIDDNATSEKFQLDNSNAIFQVPTTTTGNSNASNFVLTSGSGSLVNQTGERIDFNTDTIGIDISDTLKLLIGNSQIIPYVPINSASTINAAGMTIGGSTVWHAGNDGSGSGLDADTLDGVQGSAFAKLSGNQTFLNDLTVNGDFYVLGELNTVSSNEISIGDSFIVLNQDATTPTVDSGFRINRGTASDAELFWDESEDVFKIRIGATEGEIVANFNGVNADSLGGQSAAYYLAWNNITSKPSTFTPSAHTHSASNITSGVLNVDRVPNLSAAKITSGTLSASRIPTLDGSKIGTGTVAAARIASLDASKITTGTLGIDRIPSLIASKIPNLDASKITSGIFSTARIPNLSAAKITSGSFPATVIPNLDASKITSGIFSTARIPTLDTSKITSGTLNINRIPSIPFTSLDAGAVLLSTESWSNSNTLLPTTQSVENRILSKGYTSNTGDITNVIAGNGLSGGGASGSVTLNIGAGTGISVASNSISVNMGAFSTSNLSEGTNQYFTTGRAQAAITKTHVDSLNINSDTLDGYHAASMLRTDSSSMYFRSSINHGYLGLLQGSTNNTGYISFHKPDTTRIGYIGFGSHASDFINIASENGYHYNFTTTPKINGSNFWHAGNDGSGSGLDADTVDGVHASSFLRSNISDTYSGDLLTISQSGTDMGIPGQPNTLQLFQSAAGADAFLTFHISNTFAANFGIDGSTNDLTFGGWSLGSGQKHKIWHAGNDGGGSGLDADTVDGIHASSFLRSDTSDTITGNLSVTGELITPSIRTSNGQQLVLEGGEAYAHSTGQTDEYVYINAEQGLEVNSSLDNWASGWAGRKTTSIRGNVITVNGSTVWNAGNDGSGSGLDADTLDGYHASVFMRNNTAFNKTSGDLTLYDSVGINFGNSTDFRMVHNGSHQYFEMKTGNMYMRDVNASHATRFTFSRSNGNFTASGDITAYSDARLKTNIEIINGALEKVESISGVYYNWTKEANKHGLNSDRRQVGVLAHEIEDVLSEAVWDDGEYKQVAYDKTIPLLIEAIKELSEKVKTLEGRLNG